MSLNEPTLTITGNLVNDPELRFTGNGQAVAAFTVAQNPRYRDTNGEWKDGDTVYLRCTAWRQVAENICESLQRGDPVIVVGRLRINKYQDKQGIDRQANDIQVDTVGVTLERNTVRIRRNQRTATGTASNGQATDQATDQASGATGEPASEPAGNGRRHTAKATSKTADPGKDDTPASEPPF